MKGATEMLAEQIKRLGSVILGGVPEEALELAEGTVRIKGNPEAALPFMACGAIINANNAGLPEDLDVTLNCRYVYRPPFEVPDVERKFGNLTLTYAAQIHAAVVEIDPETGYYEVVDYAAVDDCGVRIHPQIVEGQVMGATAQALGAAVHESFEYDEEGNLLTPNFYDYHVPHALDMPPLQTGYIESASPFTPLGTKGMGEGGGAGIHAVCAALQDATGRGRLRQLEPVQARVGAPHLADAGRDGGGRMNVAGERQFDAPRDDGVAGAERSRRDGEDDAGRRELRRPRREALDREREDPARPRRPEDEGRHGEDRGARAGVRGHADQGPGRRRDDEHADEASTSARPAAGTKMKWAADVKIAGPVGSMGQRVLQPIVNQQVQHVLSARSTRRCRRQRAPHPRVPVTARGAAAAPRLRRRPRSLRRRQKGRRTTARRPTPTRTRRRRAARAAPRKASARSRTTPTKSSA